MRIGDPNIENLGEMVSETQVRNSLHRQSFLQVLFKCGESVDAGEDFGERVECVVTAQALSSGIPTHHLWDPGQVT